MNAEQAWQAVIGQLQMEMPRGSFDTWVRDTRFLEWSDGNYSVGVRNEYARDWLENRLVSTVDRLLAGMLNQSVRVHFVVDNQREEDDESGVETQTRKELPAPVSPVTIE